MAFIAPEQQEEEMKKGDAPALSGTGAGSLASASSQGPTVAGGKNTGQFVGINRYLDANKSNIPSYAGKLAGSVNQSADDVVKSADQVSGDFQSQVNSNTPKSSEEIKSKSLTDIAGNEGLKGQFLAQKSASYTGPESISAASQADLNAKKAKAETRLGNLINPKAISDEVRQSSLNPTAGKTAFNTSLVQAAPEAQKLFQTNREQQMRTVNSRLQQLADQQKQAVEQAKAQAATVSRETNERLKNESVGLDQKVRAQAAKIAAERAANKNAVDTVFARGGLNGLDQATATRAAQELFGNSDTVSLGDLLQNSAQSRARVNQIRAALAGVDPADQTAASILQLAAEREQTIDPRQYLRARGGDVTLESAASNDDFAKLQALKALEGDVSTIPLDLAKAGAAGTASSDVYDYDYGAASNLSQNRVSLLDQLLNRAQSVRG